MEEVNRNPASSMIKEENPRTPPEHYSMLPTSRNSDFKSPRGSSTGLSANMAFGVSPDSFRSNSCAETLASGSHPVFPQKEARSTGQVLGEATGRSGCSALGVTEEVSSDVLGLQLSSEISSPPEAGTSHVADVSKGERHLMTSPPAYSSSISDTAQPRHDLTQENVFPQCLQRDSKEMEDSVGNSGELSEVSQSQERPFLRLLGLAQEVPLSQKLGCLSPQSQQLSPPLVKTEREAWLFQSSCTATSDKDCVSDTHENVETKTESFLDEPASDKGSPEPENKRSGSCIMTSAKTHAQNIESRYRTRRYYALLTAEASVQNTGSKNEANRSSSCTATSTLTLPQNTESKNVIGGPSTSASAKTQTSSAGSKKKTCPECHKTFSRPYSLTLHLRVHTGDRPFQCEECDATYKLASHLQNHVRSKHSTTKAYKCGTCSKPFSTQNAKRRHEKNCGVNLSDRVKYQCTRCQRHFVTEHGYEKHKKLDVCVVSKRAKDTVDNSITTNSTGDAISDQKGRAFRCTVCPKSFAELSSLETHQRFLCGKGPGAAPYTCSECEKVFMRWMRFVSHCRWHTGERPHICSQCGARFSESDNLRKHEFRHRERSVNKCSLCEKRFGDKKVLSVHIMRVHCGLKPYKCNECEKDFASAKHLSTHVRAVHRKEKRFKCQVCEKGFFRSEDWKKHTSLHTRPPKETASVRERRRSRGPVREHVCNLCGAALNMILMRRHVEEQHPGFRLSKAIGKTMVGCEICQREFCNSNSLDDHLKRRHSEGPKDFKCNQCDMCFFLAKDLKVHQIKHTEDRPYVCEACGETFRWNASFREHKLRLHNPSLDPPDDAGRRFACEDCGRRFMRHESLKFHRMRHTGKFPCVCSKCGKGFPHVTALRSHMSCHSGADMSFICDKCGAGFHYSSLLKGHIQRRHSPSPWLCYLCGRTQCSKNSLKLHLQAHAKSPDGVIRGGRFKFRKSGMFITEPSNPKVS